MKVAFARKGQVLVVRLSGELDEHAALGARTSIDDRLRRGGQHLLFDFRKLTFMDSTGIGLILGRYKEIHPVGGMLAYFGADKQVQRLLKISGLLRIGKLYATEEEALLALKKEGGSKG